MVTLCLMPSVEVGELDPIRKHSEGECYKNIPGRHHKSQGDSSNTSYVFCVAFVDVIIVIVILCSQRTKTETSLCKK